MPKSSRLWSIVALVLVVVSAACGGKFDDDTEESVSAVPEGPYATCDEAVDGFMSCENNRLKGAFVVWGHRLPAPDAALPEVLKPMPNRGVANYLILASCLVAIGGLTSDQMTEIERLLTESGMPIEFDDISPPLIGQFCPDPADDIEKAKARAGSEQLPV